MVTVSISFDKHNRTNFFRELNKRLTHDACIKIIQQGERVSAEFADCFTASVTGDTIEEIEEVSFK